jgi:hypothetical protein
MRATTFQIAWRESSEELDARAPFALSGRNKAWKD